jgi:formylglycine-generating enzyme required for sulfatase activity
MIKKSIVIFWLIMVRALFLNAAVDNAKARELINKGYESFQIYKNSSEAFSYYKQAIELASGYTKASALVDAAYMSHLLGNKLPDYQDFIIRALDIDSEIKLEPVDYQASFREIFNNIKIGGGTTIKPAVTKPTPEPVKPQPKPTAAKPVVEQVPVQPQLSVKESAPEPVMAQPQQSIKKETKETEKFLNKQKPLVVEQEGSKPVIKKKKKFPWLIAALGATAVVAVVVALLSKKGNSQAPNIEMISIPGGTFQMGSVNTNYFLDEQPVHTVTLSPFQMGKYEVTQGQWIAVIGGNPSMSSNGDNYPVEHVSWDDVQTFIKKLNTISGKHYRLPTEAEWEYACRAGTTGDRYGNIESIAWYRDNSGNKTHPVGQKQANAWGLYDMLGNVQEWCQDWYGPYSSASQTNPTGPASSLVFCRIQRGGNYFQFSNDQWAAIRSYYRLDYRSSGVGLRLAAPMGD